jgi:NosR/NirI family transcriptional regulator, nitrous oxide reductase regulator
MRRYLTKVLTLLVLPVVASAVERFPPPDFSPGYKMPVSQYPPARAEFLGCIDVAVLALALILTAYFALRARSRRGVVVMTLFSLAYFGFYRQGCICSIGAIQNVTLAVADKGYALPLAAGVFFLLPIFFALFVGRAFCAGVCPLGAAQDVVLLSPVKVPKWLAEPLGLLPWLYLGAAVLYAATGTTFLICRYDPFVAFFRVSGNAGMLIFGTVLLLLGVFVGRPYCRFLCPYGAILGVFAPLSRWKVTITPDQCVDCKLCGDACPFGAIRRPIPAEEPARRLEGKNRLAATLMLLPVLVGVSAFLGYRSGRVLSQLNPTVLLAQHVMLDEAGKVADPVPDDIKAFRKRGDSSADLYKQAINIYRDFRTGGLLLGGWVGLVFGLKLVGVSLRRRRTDWEADSSGCIACGRCYKYCPVERQRLGIATSEDMELLEGSGE